MSKIPFPPSDDLSNHKEEKPFKHKKPEFIILDSTQDYINEPHLGSSIDLEEDELWQMQKGKNPFWIRLFFLIGVLICLFFAAGIMAYVAFLLGIATLSLFQNSGINQSFLTFWRLFKNTLVVTVSLAIGIFSPTLGIGMLVVYFSLKGTSSDRTFLKKIIKKFL